MTVVSLDRFQSFTELGASSTGKILADNTAQQCAKGRPVLINYYYSV